MRKVVSLCIIFAALALPAALPACAKERRPVSQDVLPVQALSASDLAGISGGASPSNVAISAQTVTAVNYGNSIAADSVVTGNVELQSGALTGFSGIGNFVFNTGNNNNLQGTLSVTILTPAAK